MFCYILVFLLPGIAIGVYFSRVQRVMEEDLLRSYEVRLEQASFLSDNRLLELSNTLHKVNQALTYFYQEHHNSPTEYQFYELQNLIRGMYIQDLDIVADYCILDNRRGIAFSSDGIFSMDEQAAPFSERDGFGGWREFADGHYYQRLAPYTQDMLMYYSSFPVGKTGKPDFQILLLLNASWIRDAFLSQNGDEDSTLFLMTGEDGLLCTGGAGFQEGSEASAGELLKDERYTAFTQPSSIQGTSYHLMIRKEALHDSGRTIYTALWMFFAGSLLLVLAFLIYLSFQRSKPLTELLELIDGWNDTKTGRVYQDLEHGVKSLLVGYRDAANILQEQKPLLRSAVFRAIIQGKRYRGQEIGGRLTQYGIVRPSERYMLLLCQIGGGLDIDFQLEHDNLNQLLGKAEVIVGQCFAVCGELIQLDQRRLAAILCFDASFDSESCFRLCRQAVEVACQEADKNIETPLIFGISEPFETLEELPLFYRRALEVLEHNVLRVQNEICFCQELEHTGCRYEYSMEEEQQLINFTLAGSRRAVHDLLKEVYSRNIIETELSTGEMSALAEALCLTVKRVAKRVKCDTALMDEIEQLSYKSSLPEVFGSVNRCLKAICDRTQSADDGQTALLVEQAVDYISLHLSEPSLCVQQIAGQLGVAEKYLAVCFKEERQQQVSAYIEKARIGYACDLLANNGAAVSEIAEKVGYNSDRSFRRAFKRLMGLNPTDYKHSCRGGGRRI